MKLVSEKIKSIILPLKFVLALTLIISCSSEEESFPEEQADLNFQISFNNISESNRQSMVKLPDCSAALPSYAEVVLIGPENVGSVASPEQIDFSSDTETASLSLSPGTYQLEYFAVYDEADNMIWFAPNASDFTDFVASPLPSSVEVNTYNTSSLPVQVVCYDNRVLIDPDAITAEEYVSDLGVGFDVTWSEFGRYMDLYQEQVVIDFADAGFTNVRIRMNEENPDATFMANLKAQVDHCLAHGIKPILAYQGFYLEESATSPEDAREHLSNWWRNMAEFFQGYPPELAFNVLVEISGNYKKDPETMNFVYEGVYEAIRETNPSRNIIFPPVNISNPDWLSELEIPGGDDPYTMAEWHFYAAGPDPTPGHRKYWNDGTTLEERENITAPIETAVAWMNETGYVSWVGAWMAGNYNKGNDYTVEEQVGIASFVSRTLNSYDIPYSLNAGNKYYDYENLEWFNRTTDAAGIPVRDAILDPDKASIYAGIDYTGDSARLDVGTYNSDDLSSLGMLSNITSVMVPFDYEVIVYDGDNQTGTSQILDITTRDLSGFDVRSMEVIYLNSY